MGSAEGSGNNEKCEYGDFARVVIEVWLRSLTKQIQGAFSAVVRTTSRLKNRKVAV